MILHLIHRIRNLQSDANIIFLDFFICPPIRSSQVVHLETNRFTVPSLITVLTSTFQLNSILWWLKSQKRPALVQMALSRWIQITVCSRQMDPSITRILDLTFRLVSTRISANQTRHQSDIYHFRTDFYSVGRSEVDLPTARAERNYIRQYLNGKNLLVSTLEVRCFIISHHRSFQIDFYSLFFLSDFEMCCSRLWNRETVIVYDCLS